MSRKSNGQNLYFKKNIKIRKCIHLWKGTVWGAWLFSVSFITNKATSAKWSFFSLTWNCNCKDALWMYFFSCTLNTASLSEICWQCISHFHKLVIIGKQIFRIIFLLTVGEGRSKQICKTCLIIVCSWVYSKRFERLHPVTWNHNAMWHIVCTLVSFMSRQRNAT